MSRKAKDLDSLIRLHRWTVDERQRELGQFLAREEDLIRTGRALDAELVKEQAIATSNPTTAGFIYAAYAGEHLRRKEQLRTTLHQVRLEIEEARERLAEAYRQLKVYEEVQKTRAKREGLEAARQEQLTLDEIGLNQHRRKN